MIKKNVDNTLAVIATGDESTARAVIPTFDMERDAGKGLEEATTASFAIPFIKVLQALSPQLETMSDAKAGMIFNSVTAELLPGAKGILVIPCHFRPSYIEWRPRDSGGGLVHVYTPTEAALLKTTKNEKFQDILPNGNILTDTRTHSVLVLDDAVSPSMAAISMTSTQLKKSRKLMSAISSVLVKGANGFFNPPSFGQVYRLTTEMERNNKGSWYSWAIDYVGLVTDAAIYKMAKKFHDDLAANHLAVKHDAPDVVSDCDIPF